MINRETDEQFSEAETARRRDATIKRMLATPPQPHKPLGKKKAARTMSATKKLRKKV